MASKADSRKGKPQLQANLFVRCSLVLSHENNLETICWAAALINKLFIVRKWLGQRLNINPNRKQSRIQSLPAKETQDFACRKDRARNSCLILKRRERNKISPFQRAGFVSHVITNGYLLLFSEWSNNRG